MNPVEALELALSKEEAAISLYKKLALEHSVIKELLEGLLNEEEKHKQIIERKISELKQV